MAINDTVKGWFNTLLAPVAIAVSGFFINNTLQTKQQSIDKLKFTQQVVSDAFDATDPAKALAMARFIPRITEDPEFGAELVALINKFYTDKALQAARSGDEVTFRAISNAATSLAGQGVSVADSIKKYPVTRKAQEAITQQENAMQKLQTGDIQSAKRSFDSAQKVFPSFKSSKEISKIIEQKGPQINESDVQRVQQEIIDSARSTINKKIKIPNLLK
ncbi:MAG TPA: hypothetical protein VIX80_06510 [Candidatus Kapabacteria bacterium]